MVLNSANYSHGNQITLKSPVCRSKMNLGRRIQLYFHYNVYKHLKLRMVQFALASNELYIDIGRILSTESAKLHVYVSREAQDGQTKLCLYRPFHVFASPEGNLASRCH